MPAGVGLPLAVGHEEIEKYIEEHCTAPVIIVDQLLYSADYLYVQPATGDEPLRDAAATAVRILRKQLSERLFNNEDPSRHILRSEYVIMACELAPGGERKMQTLVRLTGSADPNPTSLWLLKDLCDKFNSPTPPSPQRPLFASSTNQALRRARTCLEESTDDEEMLGDQRNSLQVTRADLAKAALDSVLQLMDANKKIDALDSWKQ